MGERKKEVEEVSREESGIAMSWGLGLFIADRRRRKKKEEGKVKGYRISLLALVSRKGEEVSLGVELPVLDRAWGSRNGFHEVIVFLLFHSVY